MNLVIPRRRRLQALFQRIEESTTSLTSAASSSRLKLCEICQLIRFQPLREGKVHYHGTPEEIATSAQAGCPFCCLLVDNFDLGPSNVRIRLTGIRRKLSLQERVSLVEEGDIEALGVFNGYDRETENPFAHVLALYTTYDDIAATRIARRPFISDFATEATYRLIKSWLDACVFHHPGCNSPVISRLPTRVIDVGLPGSLQDPRLFTPPVGYKDSYIALSYCWGTGDSKFVLTLDKALLPELRFPFHVLPKTMRDAVTITQKLGFRFLWIDALCIIQHGDGGEDFRRESATMSQVYGNATLTIAAAAASNVHEGIFRKPVEEPQPEVKIPYDLPGGFTGTAYVQFEDVEKGSSQIQEPLNTRGWTFQERILSPRVVLFYKDQLSWDCTSTIVNSSGPLNPLVDHSQDSPGRYSDYIGSQIITRSNGTSDKERYMAYWRNSIEFYSRRVLTDKNDKLKAIAGLAQLIKSKTDDNYVAGLWRSDLRHQLFWYVLHADTYTTKKQEIYRAPSWSWASIDGQIRFRTLQGKNDFLLVDFTQPTQYHPEEVDIDFNPKGDEFGDIVDAKLKIMGYLHDWDPRGNKLPHTQSEGGIYLDDNSEYQLIDSQNRNAMYFFFYPCPITGHSAGIRAVALILRKQVPDYEVYERVGIYSWQADLVQGWKHQWNHRWDGNLPKIITIE